MPPALKRVVITGGCGFVGVNLTRHLTAIGHDVVAFDDLSSGDRTVAESAGARVVVGDVRDLAALHDVIAAGDAVIHLAAQTGVVQSVDDPLGDLEINVRGTMHALVAARDAGASAFVFASSSAPLGAIEPPGHEEIAPRPLSPYGASKLAGEGMCSAFAASYGLPTVALRFTNLYGPDCGHKGSVVAAFMRRIISGEPLIVYGDGQQTRDFLFVDDLGAAVAATIESPPAGELFQLGTGVETTVAELVDSLRALFPHRDIEVLHEPVRAGEIQRSWSDISRARELLGFDPRVTLDEGLVCVRDWFERRP